MEDRVILEVEDWVAVLTSEIDSEWINEDRTTKEIISIFSTTEDNFLGAEVIEWVSECFDDCSSDKAPLGRINEAVYRLTTAIETLVESGSSVMEGNLAVLNLLDIDLHAVEGTHEVFGIRRAIDHEAIRSGSSRISEAYIHSAGEGHDLRAGNLKNGREIFRCSGIDDVHPVIDITEETIANAEGTWAITSHNGRGIIDDRLEGILTLNVRRTSRAWVDTDTIKSEVISINPHDPEETGIISVSEGEAADVAI